MKYFLITLVVASVGGASILGYQHVTKETESKSVAPLFKQETFRVRVKTCTVRVNLAKGRHYTCHLR